MSAREKSDQASTRPASLAICSRRSISSRRISSPTVDVAAALMGRD
jgi:hypothetical protein